MYPEPSRAFCVFRGWQGWGMRNCAPSWHRQSPYQTPGDLTTEDTEHTENVKKNAKKRCWARVYPELFRAFRVFRG